MDSDKGSIPKLVDDGWWTPARKAFLVVAIAALPLLLLFQYGVAIISSDSAVVIDTAAYVQKIDHAWLLQTQEPPLLQAVYGPLLSGLEDSQPLVLVPILLTVALAALTGGLAARLTKSTVAGVFAGLFLLATEIPVSQSRLLPLYAGFIAFGMLSVWFAARYVREDCAPLKLALWAAFFCLLAVTAHGAGLYFLIFAFVAGLFVRDKNSFGRYVKLVVALGLFMLPWLISHLWVDGLHQLLTARSTWFVSKGYLSQVSVDYFHQAVAGPGDIVVLLPKSLLQALGWTAIIAVPLCVVALTKMSRRAIGFMLLAPVGLVAPMILFQTRVFARYFYPLLPGIAILSAIGIVTLGEYKWGPVVKRFVPPIAIGLALVSLVGYGVHLSHELALASDEIASAERQDLERAAGYIEDGKAVIASRRSTVLTLEAPDVLVYYADMLTENEFVSYLTWDRSEVQKLLRNRDIGWALVRKPARAEVGYNATWLEPAYGTTPTYVKALRHDPLSCLVYQGDNYDLYRLAPTLQKIPTCEPSGSTPGE